MRLTSAEWAARVDAWNRETNQIRTSESKSNVTIPVGDYSDIVAALAVMLALYESDMSDELRERYHAILERAKQVQA